MKVKELIQALYEFNDDDYVVYPLVMKMGMKLREV